MIRFDLEGEDLGDVLLVVVFCCFVLCCVVFCFVLVFFVTSWWEGKMK